MARRCFRVLAPLALVAMVAGCESVSKEDAAVRENLTPELRTLSERSIDVDNTMIHAMDTNARAINNDWRRIWLLDRPMRMTREVMPR